MDSNKIQNEQTNTFSGGMNTDAADHVLGNDQYRNALNLRYVNNKESATGSLKVIDGLKNIYKTELGEDIIETSQVGQYGIFFTEELTEDKKSKIRVYRFPIEKENVTNEDIKLIFGPCEDWDIYGSDEKKKKRERQRLSVVGRKEGEDNIKLYIADGIHQIIIMDVLNDKSLTTIKSVLTNQHEQFLPPVITDIIEGSLKAGKVQYAFQMYSKYKQQTALSPLSKQINVVNSKNSGHSFIGATKGKKTNIGFKLKIQIPNKKSYDLIKIYRLYYQENAELPEIDIIYDGDIVTNEEGGHDDAAEKYFYYNDITNNSISKVSVENFNSKSGLYMIPKVIESKDDYLFAAQIKEYRQTNKKFDNINTVSLSFSVDGYTYVTNLNDAFFSQEISIKELEKDEWKKFDELTSIKDCWNPSNQITPGYTIPAGTQNCQFTKQHDGVCYYGGSGKHIDWRFITTIIPADYGHVNEGQYGSFKRYIDQDGEGSGTIDVDKYYIRHDGTLEHAGKLISTPANNQTYGNPMVASNLVSLRRGETYRFGIIFTDKEGVSSPVKWITDVVVPDISAKGFYSFMNGLEERELSVLPLGVEFNIHDIDNDNIYSYEIVRCNRGADDMKVVAQGVLSRPVIKRFKDKTVNKLQHYTPNGFLTINRLNILEYIQRNRTSGDPWDHGNRVDNFTNESLFQFVSPEVSYFKTSTLDLINKSDVKLNMLKYLFSNNSVNKTVFQKITGRLQNEIEYISLNQTNFICGSGNDKYKDGFSSLMHDPIPSANLRSKNTELFNNLNIFHFAFNAFSAHQLQIGNLDDGAVDSATYQDTTPSDSNYKPYDSFQSAMNVKYQYFKLYCQSDDVLVGDCDKSNPYNNWIDDNGTKIGYKVEKRNIYNQYGISGKQITDSLKWNDLFEVKNDKHTQKFSDKVNTIGEYGFCNVVCYGMYDEEPMAIVKTEQLTLKKVKPYALAGTSLLLTIDKELKNEITTNNRLLTETIGTDNISIMTKGSNESYTVNKNYMSGLDKKFKRAYIDDEDNEQNFLKSSMFGTVLCNITRTIVPYGGFSRSAKVNSVYYSYSDIKQFENKQNNIIQVFNGDTYIGPFEYTSAHKVSNKAIDILSTMNVQYAIPVESSINMYIDHGYRFSKNIENSNVSWIQENPGNVDNIFKQETPQYEYNSAYSITKSIDQKFSTISYDTKDKQTYNFRCRYSDKKENGELEDSWQNFKAANYIDVDPNYGKITGLKRFKNNLLFWQEKSFGAFSVNERTAVTDNNNHEILLGSGGLLSRYDYISTTSGLEDNVFAYAITTQSLYWIDAFNTVFCQYNGGGDYKQISITKNINTAVSEEYRINGISQIKRYKVLTDPRYNEVYFTSKDGVFVFNELQQLFTSRYTYDGRCDSITGKYDTFIADNVGIRKNIVSLSGTNHMRDEVKMKFSLSYIINAQPNFVKVFDNVRFGATEGMAKQFKASYHVYDGDEIKQSTYFVEPDKDISNRYYDYRYAIPRMNYPYDIRQQYGGRLRGKAVYCNVGGEALYDNMQLHYITTKFRALWS